MKHLASRTADADIGNKMTETTLMEVASDIFGGAVFGSELGTAISRLLFSCRLKVREMMLKQVHKFTSHHSDPGMSDPTQTTTRNKEVSELWHASVRMSMLTLISKHS